MIDPSTMSTDTTTPLTAQVSAPSPVPERPTLYACIRYSKAQEEWVVRVLSSVPLPSTYTDEYPGSIIATIPGSSPTPETQPADADPSKGSSHELLALRYRVAAKDKYNRHLEREVARLEALLTSRPQQPVQTQQPAGTERVDLREPVAAFASAMEQALRRHDAKKGVCGWEEDDPAELVDRIREELTEVDDATGAEAKAHELVDVANMAMMAWDRYAERCGWRSVPPETRGVTSASTSDVDSPVSTTGESPAASCECHKWPPNWRAHCDLEAFQRELREISRPDLARQVGGLISLLSGVMKQLKQHQPSPPQPPQPAGTPEPKQHNWVDQGNSAKCDDCGAEIGPGWGHPESRRPCEPNPSPPPAKES